MPRDMIFGNLAAAGRPEACEYLRARHLRFIYESFSLDHTGDALRVRFRFRIAPDIEFAPEIRFEGVDGQRLDRVPAAALENLVFHLGLVEMLSYWKAACSPEILVQAGALDSEQIAWWMDLIAHGMGEFFYVNRIDSRAPDFLRIVSPPRDVILSRSAELRTGSAKDLHFPPGGDASKKDLVLTSGGKDSVVTLELLREAGREFDCLLLNPTQAALAVAPQAGCAAPLIVRRSIDPRLLELNRAGYLNGHTPFSALLAFLGVTVGVLGGYRRVIVSNERSAEEPAAEFMGREVNHQYSKSFRFETAFRSYSEKYLTGSVEYFSLLRPLYELQIARLFAGCPQYFPVFKSCNRAAATNSWCGRCPKCLFVFLALYPFVSREQMLGIFGQDLFAWEGAAAGLRALLGLDRDKPFECVGTREETLAAVYLCLQKYREQGIVIPPALSDIEATILSSRADLPEAARRVLSAWTEQHHLPPELAETIQKKVIRR